MPTTPPSEAANDPQRRRPTSPTQQSPSSSSPTNESEQNDMNNKNTGLFLFTTLLWGIFFTCVFLFAALVQGYPGMIKKADTDGRPRLYRAKEMVQIMKEMRAGDYRLVRPHPTEETIVEQHRYCPTKMASFLMTLCTSTAASSVNGKPKSKGKMTVSLHKRGLAAEAIALCLTDQPAFRDLAFNTTFMTTELKPVQQKQLVGHSLAEGLTVLLKEGLAHYRAYQDASSLVALSQAAETVWIASFHHPDHIEGFLNHNTIQVLGDIIVSNRPDNLQSGGTVDYPYPPARAVMWACAALQNLAANYCDNELGYCIWKWQQQQQDEDGTTGESILALDEVTKVLVRPDLASQARHQMARIPHLLETLEAWICHGGPIHAKANDTYGWPGDALLWKDLTFNAPSPHLQSPSIVPWAAAGMIKNLVLGKHNDTNLRQQLHSLPNLPGCLCRMMQQSPDWLEDGKATDAVFFWGAPSAASEAHIGDTICGPDMVYDNCQDDTSWVNAESGDTCVEYTQEKWCIEYGEDVNENGKTAEEACCACGGGYPISEAQGGEASKVGDEQHTSMGADESHVTGGDEL